MAKEIETKKEVTVNDDKTPIVEVGKETTIAPVEEKPVVGEATEAPGAKDFSDVLMLLNIMDKEVGGKGMITELPEDLRGSIEYMAKALTFVKDRYDDPLYKDIMDDMFDQEEDGQTPSLEVAIARNISIERLQELADSEDYAGAQGDLADGIAAQAQTDEEDAQYDANFQASQQAGEEYATEMGYDEARKNQLFQEVMDLLTVFGDGVLTKDEFAKVDKILNYGPDTEALRNELSNQGSKEVLPDQASIDAATDSANQVPAPKAKIDTPGLESLNYSEPAYLKTGQKRFGKQ